MNLLAQIFRRRRAPLDNVTPRAQKLLVLARKEADRFHHSYVGTEHLLGGLISLGEGVGLAVLQDLRIDLSSMRQSYEQEMILGALTSKPDTLPFTPAGRKVLELGAREAIALGNDYLGTEHILLGLLGSRRSLGFELLSKAGLRLDAARDILKARKAILEAEARSKNNK